MAQAMLAEMSAKQEQLFADKDAIWEAEVAALRQEREQQLQVGTV